MALLLLQPDLGNAVLLAGLVGLLLIVAGTRLSRLIAPGLVGIAGIAAYVSYNPYALRRITGFMNPWATSQGEGYQLTQSFVAFGRGGLFGVGLGNGQQKLAYLPEAHTDFILSLVAEELGLVGVLVVLGGFVCLLVAGSRIAAHARDRFALLVAFGMTSLLTLPAIINAAVVMGMLPTKGLTLPFLSYGRTSLVMCCVALGLLLSAAREPAGSRSKARRKR
jgi:cell division protein FtsW